MKQTSERKRWRPAAAVSVAAALMMWWPVAQAAFLLMDAPESVYRLHEFEVDVYVYDAFDLYGLACDIEYSEALVDAVDAAGAAGIQVTLTEGDFFNESGAAPTLMRGALQDGKAEGIAVVGLVRSGQTAGVNTGPLPELALSVRYRASAVGTAQFAFATEGLTDSEGTALPVEVVTGTTVEILPFTDTAPAEPSAPDPPDEASAVPADTSLGWSGGDADAEDEVTYQVYLDESNPPTTLAATVTYAWDQTACAAPGPGLLPATQYYWRVVATDKFAGLQTSGPVWRFTTSSAAPTATPLPPTATATPLPPTVTPTPQPPTETPACVHDGDVTSDGVITAGDAQRAFQIALGMITPSYTEECAADCNDDGQVTAGDGQLIFMAALGSGSCADPLGGGFDGSFQARSAERPEAASPFRPAAGAVTAEETVRNVVSVRAELTGGPTLTVTVSLRTAADVDAFTLDLGYCAELLEFAGGAAADLDPEWLEFGAAEIAPGVVRIAGLTLQSAVPAGSDGALATLTFTVRDAVTAAEAACALQVLAVYDDLTGFRARDTHFSLAPEAESEAE